MKILPDRIASKIWMIIAVFAMCFLGAVLFSFKSKGEMQQKLAAFSEHSKLANTVGRQLVTSLDAQIKAYQDAVVSADMDLITEAATYAEEVQSSIEGIVSIASTETKTALSELKCDHSEFSNASAVLYPILMGDDAEDEDYEKSAELSQQRNALKARAAEITTGVSANLSRDMDALVKELGHQKTLELAVSFSIVVVLVLFVTFMVRNYIVKPIGRFIESTKVLTTGDLRVRYDASNNDELAYLGQHLNDFLERLSESIRKIGNDSSLLKTYANETNVSAESIQTDAQGMTGEADTVSNSGEQLSGEILSISGNAEQMTQSATTVAGAIEEMNAAISEVARQCTQQSDMVGEAHSKAKVANDYMQKLGGAAKEIQNIVELINDIAAQTNLLALNATIEAASAGDAGKGFAVVANEVKDLARQSSESSERIRTEINGIHEKTKSSLEAVEDISEIIEKVLEYSSSIAVSVEQQSATNNEISGTMQTVSNYTEEVSDSVKTASESAENVSKGIWKMSGSITGIKQQADDTHSRSLNLTELSDQLRQAVSVFQTG